MKTAMERLIDKLIDDVFFAKTKAESKALNNAILKAQKLLETEKQQIIEAYDRGISNWDNTDDIMGEEYYNQTVKTTP